MKNIILILVVGLLVSCSRAPQQLSSNSESTVDANESIEQNLIPKDLQAKLKAKFKSSFSGKSDLNNASVEYALILSADNEDLEDDIKAILRRAYKRGEVQLEDIKTYALAYLFMPRKDYRKAITKVLKNIEKTSMNNSGALYSANKDNVQADINGVLIEALAYAYKALEDMEYLTNAKRAAQTIIINHRQRDIGAFKHTSTDDGSSLEDNLYMARALLTLYEVTAEREWLDLANTTAQYITKEFKSSDIELARFLNLLSHYTGDESYSTQAKDILSVSLAEQDTAAGILILNRELSNDPVHFTVVGSKSDIKARELHMAAIRFPSSYTRIEWYDKNEGKLLNHDVEYPDLPKAAAFSCMNKTCSLPIYESEELLST